MSHEPIIRICKDPKTDPSGMPDSMTKGNESIPEKCTQDCLLVK
jgi:hypothetical protein